MAITEQYPLIDNYIYMYHTGTYIVLPTYPHPIQDTMQISYSPTNLLGRSAPIYSYSYSGPRTIQFSFELHRDMMYQINRTNSSVVPTIEEDYVDRMIKEVQAASVPNYDASKKMVDPPMVAVRIGDEIYIKGVISSTVMVTYDLPILSNNKFAQVSINFGVNEVDPFDAEVLMKIGSFRKSDLSLAYGEVATLPSTASENIYNQVSTTPVSYYDEEYSIGGTPTVTTLASYNYLDRYGLEQGVLKSIYTGQEIKVEKMQTNIFTKGALTNNMRILEKFVNDTSNTEFRLNGSWT